jgi:parvulin-like peptidyl-prolyl isomerase
MKWSWLLATCLGGVGLTGCQAQGLAAAGSAPVSAPTTGPQPAAVTRLQNGENPPAPGTIHTVAFETTTSQFPELPDRGNIQVRVRAEVNGVAILDREVREGFLMQLSRLPPGERAARQGEIFRRELQNLIDTEVILQDAMSRLTKNAPQFLEKLKSAANKEFDRKVKAIKAASGARTDEELKSYLSAQGISLEGMRRRFEHEFIAHEYMRNRAYPAMDRIGHEQIQEYYDEHRTEFQTVDQVQWQDIFVDVARYPAREDARRMAEQLASRARAGESWEKMAAYDNGDSSYRHGEGFGRRRGDIRPAEAEAYLFQAHDGEVGPVIELSTGFHVIRLVKRDYAGVIPLDIKTQREIRKKLQNQAAEKEYNRLVAELKQHASIHIVDSNP